MHLQAAIVQVRTLAGAFQHRALRVTQISFRFCSHFVQISFRFPNQFSELGFLRVSFRFCSDFVQILFRFPPLKMRVPEVSSVPQTRGRTLLKTPSAPVQPEVRVSGHLLSVREEATATMAGLRRAAWKCLRHRDARAKIKAFLLWERHGALSQAHA